MMKLLISAYACRPDMGSEPAVGWSWVTELSKHHELWVLTNYTNKHHIEEYLQNHPGIMMNVRFVYVRPNAKLTFWYKEWERLERVYYHIWQIIALKVARQLNTTVDFDLVQHLTYVTCILPTYMHTLGIPFIYGPISGGERIPRITKYPMNRKDRIVEIVRNLTQALPRFSLNTHQAFKRAAKIVVVTEDTVRLVPNKFRDKVEITQAIGLNDDYFFPVPKFINNEHCKMLIAGRMLSWKGFEAGISATVKAIEKGADVELTVLGSGNEAHVEKLREIAREYCDKQIHFIKSVDYSNMKSFYEKFDVLLNCSLRDSGCLVVMEGMSRGLPVICINTGGPKVNTTSKCAIKVEPSEYRQLVCALAEAIFHMAKLPEMRSQMGRNAYSYAFHTFRNSENIKNFLQFLGEEK